MTYPGAEPGVRLQRKLAVPRRDVPGHDHAV